MSSSAILQLWTNNAVSLLQVSISSTDTTIHLQPGLGIQFPQPSNPGEFFLITLEDLNLPTVREIIKVTGRSGDALTGCVRGWEQAFGASAPLSWSAGTTLVDHRSTAGTILDSFRYGFIDDGNVSALNAATGTGIYALTSSTSGHTVSIASTNSQITVSNGNGVAGNPTLTFNPSAVSISTLTGTLPITMGGTGHTTKTTAFNALSPITNAGDLIIGTGSNVSDRLSVGSEGQVLAVVGGSPSWTTIPEGSGTVTSINVSGGSTGLITTGGPVTSSGIITLNGTLNAASGGTGLTSLGSANQVLGINSGGSAYQFKTISAGANVTITNTGNQIIIAAATSGGGTTLQLYTENPISPSAPSAVGTNAVAIGQASQAIADDSVAIGPQSIARHSGSIAWANGRFASSGDSQFGQYMLRASTVNAVPAKMFINGSETLTMPDNSTWTFKAIITGHRTDASDGHLGVEFRGVIYRASGAGTTAIQGQTSQLIISRSNTSWNVSTSADTINGGLSFTVNGQNGKTIRWLAVVETVEVSN